MLFYLGVFTVFCLSALFAIKKTSALWEGKFHEFEDTVYKLKVLGSAKNTGAKFGIKANEGYDYTFKRESSIDRFFKWAGFASKYKVGDSKFDDLVFIVSDNVSLLKRLSDYPKLTSLILEIFACPDGDKLFVEKIRHGGGCLWVEFGTHSKFEQHDVQDLAPTLIPLLEQLAEEIHKLPLCSKSFWKNPQKYISGLLLGISSALLITGALKFLAMPSSQESLIIEPFWLYLHTFIFGSVGVLILAVLTMLLLRKKSGVHLVLLEVIIIGGIGSFLISFTQLEHINRVYDKSKVEIFDVKVLDKKKFTTHKSRKYYIYTEGWGDYEERQKLRVGFDLYTASSVGGDVSVYQKSGKLGYRWLSRLHAWNKVHYSNDKSVKRDCLMHGFDNKLDSNEAEAFDRFCDENEILDSKETEFKKALLKKLQHTQSN